MVSPGKKMNLKWLTRLFSRGTSDNQTHAAFWFACHQGNLKNIVDILNGHNNLDINATYHHGRRGFSGNSLELVCLLNRPRVVELLMMHPKINLNGDGKLHTPLNIAIGRGRSHLEIIIMLAWDKRVRNTINSETILLAAKSATLEDNTDVLEHLLVIADFVNVRRLIVKDISVDAACILQDYYISTTDTKNFLRQKWRLVTPEFMEAYVYMILYHQGLLEFNGDTKFKRYFDLCSHLPEKLKMRICGIQSQSMTGLMLSPEAVKTQIKKMISDKRILLSKRK